MKKILINSYQNHTLMNWAYGLIFVFIMTAIFTIPSTAFGAVSGSTDILGVELDGNDIHVILLNTVQTSGNTTITNFEVLVDNDFLFLTPEIQEFFAPPLNYPFTISDGVLSLNGTKHYVNVRAITNDAGNIDSTTFYFDTLSGPPPSGLIATPTENAGMNLTWTKNTNSPTRITFCTNPDFFTCYDNRIIIGDLRTSLSFPWEPDPNIWDRAGVISDDPSFWQFLLDPLQPETTYYFRADDLLLDYNTENGLSWDSVNQGSNASATTTQIIQPAELVMSIEILGTCGIEFPGPQVIDYGDLEPNQISLPQTLQVQNSGTVTADLLVSGLDWVDSVPNSIINVNQTRYSGTTSDYDSMIPLTNTPTSVAGISFDPGVPVDTFWGLQANLNSPSFVGGLTQGIDITAECP